MKRIVVGGAAFAIGMGIGCLVSSIPDKDYMGTKLTPDGKAVECLYSDGSTVVAPTTVDCPGNPYYDTLSESALNKS